jgi:hypothetical protein
LVQTQKPYRQFLGTSWLEREVTIPLWTKIFKSLGIYDADYHKKYRKYLHSERYETYINLVANDIQEKILHINKKQIRELMNKKFPEPEFICPDLPK